MSGDAVYAKVYDPLEIRKNILEAAVALVDIEEAREAWAEVHAEKERVLGLSINILGGLSEELQNFESLLPEVPEAKVNIERRRESRSSVSRESLRPISDDRGALLGELNRIREKIARMRS